jgi:RNA polymerase sigma factor (sigma-70 family)
MERHVTLTARTGAGGRPAPSALVSDERLGRLVTAGHERAFAVVYERYHQTLYRYCRSILHDDAEAEDALQSTLAAALAALQRGQRDAPLRPWLFRIAHNESISLIRRRTPTAAQDEAPEISTPSAAEQAAGRERMATLVADLRELPERQRGALLMRELSGLSHEDIATALNMSAAAAKQSIFEARGSLAEFEEGRAMACENVRRAISDGDGRALRSRRMRAHLRGCAGCRTFSEAIPARRAQLQALAPPLAPALAAGVLARVLGGSGNAATGAASTAAGGGGGLAAGLAGKAAGVGTGLAAKSALGVAILATAAAGGVTGALELEGSGTSHHRASTSAARQAAGGSAHRAGAAGASAAGAPGAAGTAGVRAAHGSSTAQSARGHGHSSARVHAQGRAVGPATTGADGGARSRGRGATQRVQKTSRARVHRPTAVKPVHRSRTPKPPPTKPAGQSKRLEHEALTAPAPLENVPPSESERSARAR